MKNILQSIMVFLIVIFWFLIAGAFIFYELHSFSGLITGSLVITFGLVLAYIAVVVTQPKTKRKSRARQINKHSDCFN